jgi:hypothetical protein
MYATLTCINAIWSASHALMHNDNAWSLLNSDLVSIVTPGVLQRGRSAFSKEASRWASEVWGGSRGTDMLPWSRARGGHGRPCGGRRRRMAATGRAAFVAAGATRAGGRGGALLGYGAGRAERGARALGWAAGPKVRRRPAKTRKVFSFQI